MIQARLALALVAAVLLGGCLHAGAGTSAGSTIDPEEDGAQEDPQVASPERIDTVPFNGTIHLEGITLLFQMFDTMTVPYRNGSVPVEVQATFEWTAESPANERLDVRVYAASHAAVERTGGSPVQVNLTFEGTDRENLHLSAGAARPVGFSFDTTVKVYGHIGYVKESSS